MSSYKPIGCISIKGVCAISVLLASSQAQALALPCVGGDLGGQVFLELPVNGAETANTYGVKDANESGLEGISVTVVDANGAVPVTTDANGAWTVKAPAFPVRVQFDWNESWLQNSTQGLASNTSVQFIAGSSCEANLGLHDPSTYSQPNPDMALACYVNGTGAGSSDAGLVSTPYISNGLNSDYKDWLGAQGIGPAPSKDATVADIGSAWGAAWQADQSRLFLSTSLKRHIGMADGPGYVYVMDYSGVSASLAHKFNLEGVAPSNGGAAINLGSICRGEAACVSDGTGDQADYQLPDSPQAPSRDLDAFAKVGTLSFGDIDTQPNSNNLWLVNIFQNALISVDVSADSTALPGTINQYSIDAMAGTPTCSGGSMRPWGLSFFRGKGYLGAVCDGSVSKQDQDVKAFVLSFDPNNITAGVAVELEFALNYSRGGSTAADFHYWIDQYAAPIPNLDGRIVHPQPILSDIEFDPAGNMYLNIMDRMGHQIGHNNYKPLPASSEDNKLITNRAMGDMLKVCNTTSGFVLEGDAGCAVNFANSAGPFAPGEFFEDRSGDAAKESANGAFLSLMGSNEIVSLALDPHPTNTVGETYWHTQGINTYSLTGGAVTNWYSVNFSNNKALSGKGIGLGDIELLTRAAPVEIGNRVWNDTLNNGIQDINESGIDNVTVVLTCGSDTATATTANGGQYYFSNAATVTEGVTQAAFMDAGEQCTLSIDQAQGILTGLGLTIANADNDATNNPLADVLDSDAILNNDQAEIAVTIGQAGANNHSLDFGFAEAQCVIHTPIVEATCANSGTPSNPADDVFNYVIRTSGTHTATTYNISGQDTLTGVLYDVDSASLRNFPISSGSLSLTLTDVDDASCQLANVVVEAPATCSDTPAPICAINTPVINANCDDNGTPSDPTDDLFGYTINTSGSNTGAGYSLSGGDSQTGLVYGQLSEPFSGFAINAGNLNLTLTDVNDASCQLAEVVVTAPATCSGTPAPVCAINTPVINANCDDNGTPSDPADDLFGYTINTGGNNTGVSYSLSGGDSQTGLVYGQLSGPFSGFAINAGNLNLTLTDVNNASCQLAEVVVTAPATCSGTPAPIPPPPPVCTINTPVISANCDDNGTPSDPADDLFGYTINASGNNTGASYNLSGGDSQTGLVYGQLSGPFSGFAINAGNLNLTLTDVTDSGCVQANVTVTAPATCSNTAPPIAQDFGDAPASYGTATAGHTVINGLQLGITLDDEPGGQASDIANGDGTDEDGVIIPELKDGQSITLTTQVTNTTGTEAHLVCWIDYNGDGLFATDGSESGSARVASNSNPASVNVAMPSVLDNSSRLTGGHTFVRCRLTTDPITQGNPSGPASNGEIEDYRVSVKAQTEALGPTPPVVTTPIPTLSEWMKIVLSMLMVLLVWQVRRESELD